MKYSVNLPFLWFKRGEVVEESRLRRLDIRYLTARKMISEVVEETPPPPKKAPRKTK